MCMTDICSPSQYWICVLYSILHIRLAIGAQDYALRQLLGSLVLFFNLSLLLGRRV